MSDIWRKKMIGRQICYSILISDERGIMIIVHIIPRSLEIRMKKQI